MSVELDDRIGLHGKIMISNQRRRAGNRRQTDWMPRRSAGRSRATPVTTCAPSSSPESTSVEMPSLMPVLICTGFSFASVTVARQHINRVENRTFAAAPAAAPDPRPPPRRPPKPAGPPAGLPPLVAFGSQRRNRVGQQHGVIRRTEAQRAVRNGQRHFRAGR